MVKKVLTGKDNTNGFQEHPENINKTGANRKSFSSFNRRWKSEGVEVVSKKEYYNTVGFIMNLTDGELKSEALDEQNPAWIRWLLLDIQKPANRSKIMQDYRDWLFGKAAQDININDVTDKSGPDLSKLSDDELRILEVLQNKTGMGVS